MRWMWIDRIVALDKGVRCQAVKNVSLAEEHLHDHFPGTPIMPVPLIIEGMAQTAGILVGHARNFAEKVILAKITRATFDRDVYPGQTLFYDATLDRIDDVGAATTGVVSLLDHASSPTPIAAQRSEGFRPPNANDGPSEIGAIEIMFSHVDRNMAGLEFPEENFVFTDQFFNLLRNSGMM